MTDNTRKTHAVQLNESLATNPNTPCAGVQSRAGSPAGGAAPQTEEHMVPSQAVAPAGAAGLPVPAPPPRLNLQMYESELHWLAW
jgi:hypothetical protein